MANEKLYIHEFIDIIGHNCAKYMHHMTANWSPIAPSRSASNSAPARGLAYPRFPI